MVVEASLVLGDKRVDDIGYCWNSEVGVKLSVPNVPWDSGDNTEHFVLETLYRGSVTGGCATPQLDTITLDGFEQYRVVVTFIG